MTVEQYASRFKTLNVNRSGGGGDFSPHKPCMLLAVFDLFEADKLSENKVYFDDVLLTRYAEYFQLVKKGNDHINPWMPFFHLKTEGFWHLVPFSGCEKLVEAMDSARRRGDIVEKIDHVTLDEELFTLLRKPMERDILRETVILHWFPNKAQALTELVGVTQFEKILKKGRPTEEMQKFTTPVRSAAFRRLVIEAYEYRCAASGWRIILPDYSVLVHAAHIVPFSETADDRPQNGIALTPNFHWALDKNVIAPGPDHKWHVSTALDDRIADNQPLIELEGKPVILPPNENYFPDKMALEWRLNRLL